VVEAREHHNSFGLHGEQDRVWEATKYGLSDSLIDDGKS
jgi:hypothetical protein